MYVGVLSGGSSEEADASLWTAKFVVPALQRLGHTVLMTDPAQNGHVNWNQVDVWFNCLHGGEGEDGTIQAVLDRSGVRYTGSGHTASALCMDKLLFKAVARGSGVRCPDAWTSTSLNGAIIKPRYGGGSIHIRYLPSVGADFADSLPGADTIVEEFVPGRSITFGILETERGLNVLPAVAVKLLHDQSYYDQASKYEDGRVELIYDDSLDAEVLTTMQRECLTLYRAIGCKSYCRFDFIVNGEQHWLLEANTLPGLYPESNFCFAAELIGMTFDEVIECITVAAMPNFTADRSRVLLW